MKMGLRWFGEGYDTVSLEKIRQVPGVRGVITTLYGAMPGENWDKDQVLALQRSVEDAGLEVLGIESVNVHDAIKAGLPGRDQYIENYIQTIRTLGECGIHLICYNFMPVFDWTRTQLDKKAPDSWPSPARTAPRCWPMTSGRLTRWTRKSCSPPWRPAPRGTCSPGGSPSAWPTSKSCSRCTSPWTRKPCGPT